MCFVSSSGSHPLKSILGGVYSKSGVFTPLVHFTWAAEIKALWTQVRRRSLESSKWGFGTWDMDADFGSLEANECTIQRNTLHTKWIFIYLSHTKYFQLLLLIKYESVVSGSGFSFRCRCEKCIKIYIERKVCIKVCRFKWLISWSLWALMHPKLKLSSYAFHFRISFNISEGLLLQINCVYIDLIHTAQTFVTSSDATIIKRRVVFIVIPFAPSPDSHNRFKGTSYKA